MKVTCKNLVSICHTDGFIMKKHTHSSHELVYCLEGQGTAQIENQKSEFSTGNYYITRAGTQHIEKDEGHTRIIYFYFDAPSEMVPEGIHTDRDSGILWAVKRLQRELEGEKYFREDMIRSLITQILIETIRTVGGYTGKEGMRDVLQYIDENIGSEIDFKTLAAEQHYSFDRFRHIFKEYTGLSPHQYVIRARIEKAQFLLKLNPGLSLTELSYNCGFSSSSHFSKAFRTRVGMTPSEYVRSIRAKE